MPGEKFISIMQEIAKSSFPTDQLADLLQGTITNFNPLTVNIDQRFNAIEGKNLIVNRSFDTQYINLKANIFGAVPQKDTTLKISCNMQIGDAVRLLKVGRGQIFYLIDIDKSDKNNVNFIIDKAEV